MQHSKHISIWIEVHLQQGVVEHAARHRTRHAEGARHFLVTSAVGAKSFVIVYLSERPFLVPAAGWRRQHSKIMDLSSMGPSSKSHIQHIDLKLKGTKYVQPTRKGSVRDMESPYESFSHLDFIDISLGTDSSQNQNRDDYAPQTRHVCSATASAFENLPLTIYTRSVSRLFRWGQSVRVVGNVCFSENRQPLRCWHQGSRSCLFKMSRTWTSVQGNRARWPKADATLTYCTCGWHKTAQGSCQGCQQVRKLIKAANWNNRGRRTEGRKLRASTSTLSAVLS